LAKNVKTKAKKNKAAGVGIPKLSPEQRLALLQWIAEGATHGEILSMAASFTPPFEVSHQLTAQYRRTYELDIVSMRKKWDEEVISTGLAIRANRVQALIALARMLEEDLRIKLLTWTDDVKSIAVGAGKETGHERIEFKVFNKAEIQELRGIYDDIARETGGRITRTDITSLNQQIKGYVIVDPDKWPDPVKQKLDG